MYCEYHISILTYLLQSWRRAKMIKRPWDRFYLKKAIMDLSSSGHPREYPTQLAQWIQHYFQTNWQAAAALGNDPAGEDLINMLRVVWQETPQVPLVMDQMPVILFTSIHSACPAQWCMQTQLTCKQNCLSYSRVEEPRGTLMAVPNIKDRIKIE